MSFWAQAGSTGQRRAAAMKRYKWISIVSPRLRRGIILAQRPARGKLEGGTTGRGPTVFARWIVFAALAVTASIAAAQGFPERPIRIIVPLTPGVSPDTIARSLAAGLQNVCPQQVVVELIAYAKARPGELNFGSSGNGSPQHLGATLFQMLTGTAMNHVPYKGAAPAVADLLPGRIQVWIGAANTLLPHIKDGKLRLL